MSAADESKAGMPGSDIPAPSGPAGWSDAEGATPVKPKGKQGGPMTPERAALLAAGRAKQAEKEAQIRAAREAGEMTRYQLFLRGDLGIEDMDNDELSRGQFRDLGNGWSGGYVQKFAAKTHADMKRELLRRGQSDLDKAYLGAIDVLREIADSSDAKDADRLKAVTMIMERVAGKVPERIEVGGTDAFADVLQGIIDDSVREDKPDAVVREDA